jgi:actin-related protein 9
MDASLCSLYAAGVTTGLVVDVGYEKTDVTAIIDNIPIETTQITIPYGGHNLTKHMFRLLQANPPRDKNEVIIPTEQIAEKIKCSDITVLYQSSSNELATPDEDKAGVDDIASIVAGGKMEEYLANKEKERTARTKNLIHKDKDNNRETISLFTLDDGRNVVIGPERFTVADELMNGADGTMSLPEAMNWAIDATSRTCEIVWDKKSDLWQNIVVVGGGSRIKGFKELLSKTLTERFSVMPQTQPFLNLDGPISGTATPQGISGTGTSTPLLHGQAGQHLAGSHVRILRVPDYFIEWREGAVGLAEEMPFLGAQIVAKVGFGDASSRNFLSRPDYCTLGPAGIFTV